MWKCLNGQNLRFNQAIPVYMYYTHNEKTWLINWFPSPWKSYTRLFCVHVNLWIWSWTIARSIWNINPWPKLTNKVHENDFKETFFFFTMYEINSYILNKLWWTMFYPYLAHGILPMSVWILMRALMIMGWAMIWLMSGRLLGSRCNILRIKDRNSSL